MSVVSICAGLYCQGREVAKAVSAELGWEPWDDGRLAEGAAQGDGQARKAMERLLAGKPSVFDPFQHEKARSVALLNLALSRLTAGENLVFLGMAGLLIPPSLPQVLRVCLLAESTHRIQQAAQIDGLSQREARHKIAKADDALGKWTEGLWGKPPWEPGLYDILIPMDKKSPAQATEMIIRHAAGVLPGAVGGASRAAEDYALAARVQAGLVEKGHQVKATAAQGSVTLEINKKVVRFNRLEAELKRLAGAIDGVGEVSVKPGPGAHKADIYRAVDFEAPSKVLLVDDERDFVETLSERLLMRDMNAAVVYDGEQALDLLREELPEVMVLDLMMPGIDGMEVLRQVKKNYPQVEVIILTGHGSEEDRRACKKAGAFAYLQKPVNIDDLSEVMGRATSKARGGQEREG